ncbi:PR-1-like protein [Dothidotthia symphoricarpi CBS 119687]|uniref:PR-1-like protein n=1 Tax=Dothidotthia symphoricarpi CBS 119687 TaxID=1392245 RepID=A0A6A6ABX0_9PLEO|nr:PR-1-like protein [Dothidotthia symphoricarpi CBS 119687]KAF2128723.1 PR-1-like protein [Dothidotthia symphoricarpi CBS 119687]
MRSSILLASTLAMGVVLAHPRVGKLHPHLRKRHLVTETEVLVETVIIYVTAYENIEAVSMSPCSSVTAMSEPEPTSTEVFTPTAEVPSSTPIPAPTPTITPAPEPELPSSTPTPTPTPEPEPSSEPVYAPTPEPEPEPELSPTYVPPTSTSAPSSTYVAPPSSMTQAPEPNAGEHVVGDDQAYLSAGPDYEAAMLYHHNIARANHDAEPLVWDADCEAAALEAAQTCTFKHYIPEGAGQGQNLFTVSGDTFNATAGVTESWYKGELEHMEHYWGQSDIPDDVFHSVGHLTQMVWKGTAKVGCVSIDCGDKMVVGGTMSTMNKYTVCNYSPPGNVGGAYAKNVATPFSMTNLGSWAD